MKKGAKRAQKRAQKRVQKGRKKGSCGADVGPAHRPSFLGCLGNHGILDWVLGSFRPLIQAQVNRVRVNSEGAEHEGTRKAAASRGIFQAKREGIGEGRKASIAKIIVVRPLMAEVPKKEGFIHVQWLAADMMFCQQFCRCHRPHADKCHYLVRWLLGGRPERSADVAAEINVIGQSKQHLPKPTVFTAVRAICIGSRSAAEFSWEGAIDVQVAPSIPMSRMALPREQRKQRLERGIEMRTHGWRTVGVGGAEEVYDARSRLIAGVALRNDYPRLIFRSEIKEKPNSTGCGRCTSVFIPPDKPSEAWA
ncbi:hypothetical protein B0H13DRAFT_1899426 [Mycena leptocephala]|nr:hypothetical protein B0H13DRAFT_1899426 [Mycena leptocephala]